ncbi:MAG: uracil-DNA glycosylase family protein [Planctomycetota bacterium]|nr:MAG: uracil-DNA glycosylase family protein [Planctomycetota bacterium]
MTLAFRRLMGEVQACRLCEAFMPHGIRPVLQAHPEAVILIAGQAPGRRVLETGVPFDDPSGDRLRDWMGLSREEFYDPRKVAIIPMGFCYPGKGKSGDLPPRPECAEAWRQPLLERLPAVRLTLVIGQYAMKWHLDLGTANLTDTVRNWKAHRPAILPLPHPSPRNNIWLRKNPWFELEVLPYLRRRVRTLMA